MELLGYKNRASFKGSSGHFRESPGGAAHSYCPVSTPQQAPGYRPSILYWSETGDLPPAWAGTSRLALKRLPLLSPHHSNSNAKRLLVTHNTASACLCLFTRFGDNQREVPPRAKLTSPTRNDCFWSLQAQVHPGTPQGTLIALLAPLLSWRPPPSPPRVFWHVLAFEVRPNCHGTWWEEGSYSCSPSEAHLRRPCLLSQDRPSQEWLSPSVYWVGSSGQRHLVQ